MRATTKKLCLLPLWAALAGNVAGCRPFAITTPATFIELDEDRRSNFDYRAASADGVVMAVRVVDNGQRGTLAFWVEAVRNKLRDVHGYALLEESDIRSRGGVAGRQLRFGRDQSGRSYHYWVTLFVRHEGRKPRLWVIEAGGEQELFEERRSAVEAALASFAPR
jgi:hypothetical protein